MDLFTKTELLIMASVIGVLVISVIILAILEIFDKKKNIEEKNTDENIDMSDTLVKVDVPKLKTLNEDIETEEKSVVVETSVSEQEEPSAPLELTNTKLEPLIIDLEEEVVLDKKEDFSYQDLKQELLNLESEVAKPDYLEVSNQDELEEDAIISYQELLSATKEMAIVKTDSGDEPITINEAYEKFYEGSQKDMVLIPSLDEIYNSSVQSRDQIDSQSLTEIQLENTANLAKLDQEIRKTNEFLNILNELKKNLE